MLGPVSVTLSRSGGGGNDRDVVLLGGLRHSQCGLRGYVADDGYHLVVLHQLVIGVCRFGCVALFVVIDVFDLFAVICRRWR